MTIKRKSTSGEFGICLCVVFALGLVTVFASRVHAGDDSSCDAQLVQEYPLNGEQDVPLNPILIYHDNIDQDISWSGLLPSLHIEDAEGNPIEVTERKLEKEYHSCLLVYTPEETLLPNTDYWVKFSPTKEEEAWGHEDVYFKTGDAIDNTSPDFTVGVDQNPDWSFDADFWSDEPILIVSFTVCDSGGCHGIGATPSATSLKIDYTGDDKKLKLTAWDRAGNNKTMESAANYEDTSGGCSVIHYPRNSSLVSIAIMLLVAVTQ